MTQAPISDSPEAASDEALYPLVVDMDGTLIKGDMTVEHLLGTLAAAPFRAFGLAGALLEGREVLKARLPDESAPRTEGLPLIAPCIALIEEARAAGRRVVLASASDARIVAAVAHATGLFDEAMGSSAAHNLKGANKAKALIAMFGEKGFDYVGDSAADLPVWAAARRAYTIGAGRSLRARTEAANTDTMHLPAAPPARQSLLPPLLRAIRPHQWSKNLLLFVSLLASHLLDAHHIMAAALGFAAFSLAASSAYILNDLLDLDADRAHPRKRTRPFASGDAPVVSGLLLSPVLLLCALAVALAFLPAQFTALLIVYYITTLAYSIHLKTKMIVDIFTLAGLYTIRVLAGALAIAGSISTWILAFSMFFFLALAIVKRQAEIVDLLKSNKEKTAKRDYSVEDLGMIQALGAAAGFVSVLVLALYFNSPEASALYDYPKILWAICPLILYWISRMLVISSRGFMHDDPIVFAARDRTSHLVGLCVAGVVAASLLI